VSRRPDQTADLESYVNFISTKLGDLPGVDELDSHLTMKLIKSPEHQIAPATDQQAA
jgi:hypothetical protein